MPGSPQNCPRLKQAGIALSQAGYSPYENGGCLPIDKRNYIKTLCLTCERAQCVNEKIRVYKERRK